MEVHKTKKLCAAKETVNLVKRKPWNERESLPVIHLIEDYYTVYIKNTKKEGRKKDYSFKTWALDPSKEFSKEEKIGSDIAQHMFIIPTIREMQIKTGFESSSYPNQNGRDQQNKGQQMLRVK